MIRDDDTKPKRTTGEHWEGETMKVKLTGELRGWPGKHDVCAKGDVVELPIAMVQAKPHLCEVGQHALSLALPAVRGVGIKSEAQLMALEEQHPGTIGAMQALGIGVGAGSTPAAMRRLTMSASPSVDVVAHVERQAQAHVAQAALDKNLGLLPQE